MQFGPILFTTLAGILNTIQSGSNSALNKAIGQPVLAAAVVYLVGLAGVAVAAPFLGVRWPTTPVWSDAPWWAWLGGALGAVYVFAMLMVANKIGAAIFQGVSVTAAIVTALAMDHFGWLGFEQHSASPWRIAGAVLMIVGLGLIAKF